MGWLRRFSGLASDLAEHFQLDEGAVREFVMPEGRAALVDLVRWEISDASQLPVWGSWSGIPVWYGTIRVGRLSRHHQDVPEA
jgi:hypothetical protein